MSVLEQYRRQGIGTMLMSEMMKLLTEKGYWQVSLSVDVINYAYALYKKFGFRDYKRHEDSMTMLKRL